MRLFYFPQPERISNNWFSFNNCIGLAPLLLRPVEKDALGNILHKTTKENKRSFDIFELQIRENGILHVHVSGEQSVTLDQYKKIIFFIGEMLEGRKAPILVTADEFVLIDDDARMEMRKKDSNPYSCGSAIITRSTAQRIIGNFFVNTLKPERDIRMFNEEKDALVWLNSLL